MVKEEIKSKGINPKLKIVRVGSDPSDLAYERGALKRMEKCGIKVEVFEYPNIDITANGILAL